MSKTPLFIAIALLLLTPVAASGQTWTGTEQDVWDVIMD